LLPVKPRHDPLASFDPELRAHHALFVEDRIAVSVLAIIPPQIVSYLDDLLAPNQRPGFARLLVGRPKLGALDVPRKKRARELWP
jgi:hypothetical protein